MIKILKYMKKYWMWALLAPLFMVAEVIMDLFQPKLMEKIVDNGILNEFLTASEKTDVVISSGLLMLLLLVVGGACGILSAASASAGSNGFGHDLRNDAFSHVVDLSFEQKDKFTTGSLVTRITNDVTQIQNFISMAIRMFVRTIIMFIGGLVFMYLTSPIFALILLIAMPFELVLIIFILRKATPQFKVVQNKIDKVNSVVQENVNGVRVVKAYNQEESELERFNEANFDLTETTLKVQKLFALLWPLVMIILNGVIIAIIYYSGISIDKNIDLILMGNTEVLSVGKVMSGLTYVSMVLMSLIQLTMIAQNITRATVSARRINEILECNPVIISDDNNKDQEIKEKGTIEFKDVSFSYPNLSGKLIIDKLNLKINKGETIAILGATGSGKTTIVNLIPRFYDVTNGEVLVDGINVKEYDLEVLRNMISPVLQRTELFSGTIKENVLYGKENATFEEIVKACTVAQADSFIKSFNDGYDTIIGEKGSSLSGGQKQRLAIARALIRNPEIIIFDDSTSALDLATEALLYKALKQEYDNTTIIQIVQRVASARNADRIAVIDKGHLVAFDTHENLIVSCSIYQDIYDSQLKRGDDNE